ncbi:2-amino-4-hydroxy-6-hydroxymethyldihydropteridine diphosphokinase [Cryobacterium sp. PH31-AA6]|uniref:2-amino-4-hydroxy-6- hydroxymethyldihydropteridine diphosphokinase n=1 Tax=Cryobacterium sp. PH31-AA6 TaxID=3046205 RepID=UPI0024BBA220|nr:2-amino-4-hydroxy-6-hydroxymethyldihydropteridine diphosphokinase [Cryobacterium sp. PH31-AA6]MDJ0323758.1 2-amino-4-hydroxy-6-hydroxymethyldihydropteridine diphosphokinase [Cryobacterium sp. PH31-AA6]
MSEVPAEPGSTEQGSPTAATPVVLALGSNLGDRARTLAAAVRALTDLPGFELTGVSPAFQSAAVKPAGVDEAAPRYLNSVVAGGYSGSPHALLDAVNGIERDLGRVRAERWGDRTIDIDIILFGDLELTGERLAIPHPRAHERDFVLAPWLELDPAAAIPGRGPVRALLDGLERTAMPFREIGGAR